MKLSSISCVVSEEKMFGNVDVPRTHGRRSSCISTGSAELTIIH